MQGFLFFIALLIGASLFCHLYFMENNKEIFLSLS